MTNKEIAKSLRNIADKIEAVSETPQDPYAAFQEWFNKTPKEKREKEIKKLVEKAYKQAASKKPAA
jgi:uncharacterized protein (DUF2225 family)